MTVYKISLSDEQADKLADYLARTSGDVDSQVADEIRAQIPKPTEPLGDVLLYVFGVIYKRQSDAGWWPVGLIGPGYEWSDLIDECRRTGSALPVAYRTEDGVFDDGLREMHTQVLARIAALRDTTRLVVERRSYANAVKAVEELAP